jgi:hypothetical protein
MLGCTNGCEGVFSGHFAMLLMPAPWLAGSFGDLWCRGLSAQRA